mmetsp:Transcript_66800/g.186407  ORF Transcript_66800/g.186407 Transcript_66800/m.186407 type:complete len:264 (+) Transcript_66800:920-1711(+)
MWTDGLCGPPAPRIRSDRVSVKHEPGVRALLVEGCVRIATRVQTDISRVAPDIDAEVRKGSAHELAVVPQREVLLSGACTGQELEVQAALGSSAQASKVLDEPRIVSPTMLRRRLAASGEGPDVPDAMARLKVEVGSARLITQPRCGNRPDPGVTPVAVFQFVLLWATSLPLGGSADTSCAIPLHPARTAGPIFERVGSQELFELGPQRGSFLQQEEKPTPFHTDFPRGAGQFEGLVVEEARHRGVVGGGAIGTPQEASCLEE